MKKLSALLCSTVAFVPTAAFAQSTGTVEQEKKEIVVTGQKRNGVDGIVAPQGVKTRGVLTQEFIAKQRPGQSIDETINMLPGVAFQNNDPYGASGGTLNIRGFDASRISQTFDGLPLNDTGNYALYSNQQLDPELIQQVNVNLGTTDVDSPTAAATGSTVNYRSIDPTLTPGVRMLGSIGDWNFRRLFGLINTGVLTPIGTRAWFAASYETNENPYQRTSKTNKHQYNFKIYQPLGTSGDFIALAGNYNANRNRNFASVPLRTDPYVYSVTGTSPNQVLVSVPRVVGSGSTNRFPLTRDEREYTLDSCTTDDPQAGVADSPNACGTAYDYSYNPSNNGNIRINSKFTLGPDLVLTVDPSFQYVRANGGSSAVKGYEGFRTVAGTPIFGYTGGNPYFGGVDLNGDGDTLDAVEVYAPSETETHRYGLIANLRWDFAPDQSLRFSYTHDYGRHRQTGEVAYLQRNGLTTEYFPIVDPVLDASGHAIEKRNRKSFAILNKVAADYTGRFFDKLTVNVGAGLPFFERDLNNYCVTESNGSFVDCFNDPVSQQAFLDANPAYTPPTHRVVRYHKLLPTAGVSYQLNPRLAIYGDYNKGLQVPGTDNLYQSLAFPASASPKPETTDNFDAGVRYTSSRVQAQLAAWYTVFNNRLASSYDPIQDITIYRNLGTVHKYGLDGQIAYQPIRPLTLYAFGSILKSKILDNIQTGECSTGNVAAGNFSTGIGSTVCTTVGQAIYTNGLTAGKRESGAPTYLLGGRVEFNAGPVLLGVQAKRTGPRFVNDQNVPIFQSYTLNGTPTVYTVYGAKTPAYTVVDLDARISMGSFFTGSPFGRQTYLQFNLTNVFNKLYVAGFTGNTSNTSIPFAYIGAPRTFSASLNIGFGGEAPLPPVVPVVAPPPPPVAAPATQTCADGTVILATDACPVPPAPPAPPVERG